MDIGIVLKMVVKFFTTGISGRKVKIKAELDGNEISGVAIRCKDGSIQINLYPIL
jgi:hypothetical protein